MGFGQVKPMFEHGASHLHHERIPLRGVGFSRLPGEGPLVCEVKDALIGEFLIERGDAADEEVVTGPAVGFGMPLLTRDRHSPLE